MAKHKEESTTLEIIELSTGLVKMHIRGRSPLIVHRFPFKAWQELLVGGKRKNRAELESTIKHDPVAEFRECLYRNRDNKRPTLFHLPNGMFHGALASTAIDIPGAKKAQIERLTSITDVNIDLYGTPRFNMAMVRNSDMARTPDVRTRAMFEDWACTVTVQYARPQLTERVIGRLMSAAGTICGIGDWRPQKGGPYGTWDLVSENDRDFQNIKKQARATQQAAWDNPLPFDVETEELFAWYLEEVQRRELDNESVVNITPRKSKKRNGAAIEAQA